MPSRRTLAAELALVEKALAGGDLRHAAHHAAGALAMAPSDARAQALVDRLLDEPPGIAARLRGFFTAPDPAPLFPRDGWYGHEAVRARAHWRRGDHIEAFRILVDVAGSIRTVDYTPWLLEITAAAVRARQALDTGAFTALGSRRIMPTLGLMRLRPLERAALEPWAQIAARLVAAHGESQTMLAVLGAGLLRRVGRTEESIAMARAAARVAAPEARSFCGIQVGLGLRANGDHDEACATFLALHRTTRETSYLAEAGRARYDQGRFDDALALFERSGRAGGDPEIAMAVDACRAGLGQPEAIAAIQRHFPDGPPAYDDLVRLAAGDGSLIRMTDATANALRQLWEKDPDVAPPVQAKIRVTCLEPPSVLLAFALATRARAEPWDLAYEWDATPGHDPAEPIDIAGARLWRKQGKWPVQALAPPRPETLAAVAAVAAPPIPSMRDWRARAARARLDREELLAAMIHPPPPSPGISPFDHVATWQIAVALMMAALAPGEPWLRSTRREALRSLVLGPPDWTTAAALVALTEVLLDEPAALDDAREWLETLVENTPDLGHNTWGDALDHLAAHVPGTPGPARG